LIVRLKKLRGRTMLYTLSRKLIAVPLILISLFYTTFLTASTPSPVLNITTINDYIDENIKDNYNFFGLANYYGKIRVFILHEDTLISISETPYFLHQKDKLIIAGRYKALVIASTSSTVSFSKEKLIFHNNNEISQNFYADESISGRIIVKSNLTSADGSLYNLKYWHLWSPLKYLSNFTEKLFVGLNDNVTKNWAINIIFFAFLFKFFFIPIEILLSRSKRKVAYIKNHIKPLLSDVTARKTGAEAHDELMKIYREAGVTPFYTLRPLIYTIFPMPFLIAIFNVLGDSYQLSDQSFWWINDLAYPDSIYKLSFEIPLMGNSLHLLPVFMLLISTMSALLHSSQNAKLSILINQKVNIFLLGALFSIIFYPFPAALILFWVSTTIFGSILQQFIKND